MITFKDFLREAAHRTDISVEKAFELIRDNCSDMDIEKPFWRGSKKAAEECYVIQGDQGSRSSANSSNHYTVIMDEVLPKKGFPKRSQSIILANNTGENYARGYGTLYAIFPYNGVPIGMCDEGDIWHLKTEVGSGRAMSLEKWNDWFDNAGIPDYSYDDLVQGIRDGIEEDDYAINQVFGDGKYLEGDLKGAYSPPRLGVHLVTSKTVKEDMDRELWIGGKCVAVRHNVWAEMVKNKAEPQE